MHVLQEPQLDELNPCPYLPDRQKQFQYFFAQNLNDSEISFVLSMGWRKFGAYYFRPVCNSCRECTPIRVLTHAFKPSKSQRKTLKKNEAVRVEFGPLTYSKRAYEIYVNHSHNRFGQECSLDNFLFNFYTPSCPALQSEYYIDDQLIAVGFLDQGADCLSSVYFVYDTAYSHLGLGNFSILKEIEYAQSIGLPYYYLGYYIRDCQSMNYKDRFQPREYLDWHTGKWFLV
ncbi:MAG: arginyltransferase [Anaerolineae bacterium]|nr:arginyltransferase [Anaerolineae bacterium]